MRAFHCTWVSFFVAFFAWFAAAAAAASARRGPGADVRVHVRVRRVVVRVQHADDVNAPLRVLVIGADQFLGARAVAVQGTPGDVLGSLIVACGNGAVEITRLQREGKRPMETQEALRGLTLPTKLD